MPARQEGNDEDGMIMLLRQHSHGVKRGGVDGEVQGRCLQVKVLDIVCVGVREGNQILV